jgi:hypothetical protein
MDEGAAVEYEAKGLGSGWGLRWSAIDIAVPDASSSF